MQRQLLERHQKRVDEKGFLFSKSGYDSDTLMLQMIIKTEEPKSSVATIESSDANQ